MKMKQIFYGVADNATTFQLINRSQAKLATESGGFCPNPYSGAVHAGQWFETGFDEYWYFLECLPPLMMNGGAFAMSEFRSGNLTDAYFRIGERYFCMTIEVACFHGDNKEDAARAALSQAMRALCIELAGNDAPTSAIAPRGDRHVS